MRNWGLFVSHGINDHEPAVFSEPGLFLIAPDRTVYYDSILSMPVGRPPLDDLLGRLKYWREHNYPRGGRRRACFLRSEARRGLRWLPFPLDHPRQPHRAGPAADPRSAGRRGDIRHDARMVCVGVCRITRSTTSRSLTSAAEQLTGEGHTKATRRGRVELYTVSAGEVSRPRAAQVLRDPELPALRDTVRFEWAALDAWFEEDERVFVHPRSPYVRVDALRSARPVQVALEGHLLAEAGTCVMVFETGLPTRYYVDPTTVNFEHLVPTDTVTACPYKGVTSEYWSVRTERGVHPDLAWTYHFPTGAMLPIAGLISFYNEKVDIHLDGVLLERPKTHFFNHLTAMGTTEPATRKGRATRERIVDSAAALVFARGVAGTSLDDVQAAARVSKGQLYHYFRDKGDLVHAVIGRTIEQVLAAQPALADLVVGGN